ncbi:MAG: NfeD family protein [Verrucomicrobiota bacterium]
MTTILSLSVIGILAILAELVLPGAILGIVGALCLIAAAIMTFVEYGMGAGVAAVGILVVFGFATLSWWMKFFHRLPLTKQLILEDAAGNDAELEARQDLVGETGTTLTDLTPSGHARIGERKLDVMTETGSIEKGSEVEVTATRGPTIVVRKIS